MSQVNFSKVFKYTFQSNYAEIIQSHPELSVSEARQLAFKLTLRDLKEADEVNEVFVNSLKQHKVINLTANDCRNAFFTAIGLNPQQTMKGCAR